jgi:DNA-binding LacI/PurR family transcriptional regulator
MALHPTRQNAILDALRRAILDGSIAPGQRLPTRSELESRFAASSVTVQRALDILIADGFVQPRGRSGTFVADHPPHRCHFGLVIPGRLAEQDRWPHFWRALANEAAVLCGNGPLQLSVYSGIATRDETYYPALLRDVQAHRLAGLIFAANPHYLVNSPVLDSPGLPRVTIGIRDGSVLPSVINLDAQGLLALALERFAQAGRRRVALLTVPGIDAEQREFFLAEAARRGLETRPEWLQAAVIDYPAWAENAIRLLFRPEHALVPDALLITDDNLVAPATAGLAALALRCPADVDVVAHANFPWPTPSALPITRIGFDATDILKQALIDLERQRLMPERSTYSTVPPILAALDAPPSPQSNRDATLRPPCSRS